MGGDALSAGAAALSLQWGRVAERAPWLWGGFAREGEHQAGLVSFSNWNVSKEAKGFAKVPNSSSTQCKAWSSTRGFFQSMSHSVES